MSQIANEVKSNQRYGIGIDCPPFTARPDVYFTHIWTQILGKELPIPNPISKCFGAWEWEIDQITEDQRKQVGEYITSIYNQGMIRGAIYGTIKD